MIEFIEDRCTNYQHRTLINADSADVTLAFAIDFTTPGEIYTEKACKTCERPIFQLKVNENGRLNKEEEEKIKELYRYIQTYNCTSINIAGNGIYTFNKYGISQSRIDDLVTNVLEHLLERGCKIKEIRSGGQSGADEAGMVAALKLNLKGICLFPKGWRFRDVNNKDIKDEKGFKERFLWQV